MTPPTSREQDWSAYWLMSATDRQALVPELTKFDRQVLAALAPWFDGGDPTEAPPWRTAWQVAEGVRVDDVGEVRRVLRGLVHFGYAISSGWDHRQTWLRTHHGDALLNQ